MGRHPRSANPEPLHSPTHPTTPPLTLWSRLEPQCQTQLAQRWAQLIQQIQRDARTRSRDEVHDDRV